MSKNGIRNTLLLVGCGVFLALLTLFWLVRVEGYEKGVYVQEVLLDPSDAKMASEKKGDEKILIESIDYSHYSKGKWEMVTWDLNPYRKVWESLAKDRGSSKVDPEIVKLFEDPKLSTLTIYVRKQVPYQKEGFSVPYQQLQLLSQGDYYRIQFPNEEGRWAYFYHPAVQKVLIEANGNG